MKKNFLPFALPSIDDNEINEVVDTLKSGWLTTGPKTRKFEEDFKKFVGAPYALAVNSGTAGLHLALEAVGVSHKHKIITSPYTFTATAEVIRYLGAEPIFVDIDPKTFNIDVKLAAEVLATKADCKALIPVHIAGQVCDMDPILKLAKKHSLKIIEDAAHALTASYKGKMVGDVGDISVFSFYVTKTIATGEGGMITLKDLDLANHMSIMRLHGIDRDVFDRYSSDKPSWYYEVVAPGFKYNLTDIASAIGIHQLKKATLFREKRKAIAERYNEEFRGLPLDIPYVSNVDDLHAWHLYIIQLHLESIKISRNRFIELMTEEGIGTSVHFIPLHLHPYWRDRYDFKPHDFPNALDVYQRAVSLPIYPKMTDNDVDRVIRAVKSILS